MLEEESWKDYHITDPPTVLMCHACGKNMEIKIGMTYFYNTVVVHPEYLDYCCIECKEYIKLKYC